MAFYKVMKNPSTGKNPVIIKEEKKFDITKIFILAVVAGVGVVIIFLLIGNMPSGQNAIKGSAGEAKKDSLVFLDYTLGVVDASTVQGIRVVQTTDRQVAIDSNMYSPFNAYQPINVTIGISTILPAFAEHLIGMKAGDEKTFVISPENGYGQYDPNLVRSFSLSMINATQLRIGSRITSDIGTGTVVGMNTTHATIDFNNILAGYTLVYKVKVLKVESFA